MSPNKKCASRRLSYNSSSSVSFALFSRVIQNLPDIAFAVQHDGIAGSSVKTLDECAQWYYKAFYGPDALSIRSRYEYKLNPCPLAIRGKILQLPQVSAKKKCKAQCDHALVVEKTSNVATKENVSTVGSNKTENLVTGHRLSETEAPQKAPLDNNGPFVSFEDFEKNVENLYDIVWRLKLDDPYYSCRGFEDCAFEYYTAFFVSPEIRNKYSIKIRSSCPSKIKENILAVPSNEMFLQRYRKELDPNSDAMIANIEEVVENIGREGTYRFPVSFEIFKQYINYDELICLIIQSVTNDDLERSKIALDPEKRRKIFKRYYHSFYVLSDVRKKFAYRFNTTNKILMDKLLKYAEPLDEIAKQKMRVDTIVKKVERENNLLATLASDQQCLPISYSVFKRYISNLSDIVEQMLCSDENKGKSKEICAKEYYNDFYTNTNARKKYNYQLRPCSAIMRNKILALPEFIAKTGSSDAIVKDTGQEYNNEDAISKKPGVQISKFREFGGIQEASEFVEVIENVGKDGQYKFPVSFDVFKFHINYNELIRPIVAATTQNEMEIDDILKNPKKCRTIFKRYYHSFYVVADVRQKFPYFFKATKAELVEKLISFAEPLDEIAKQKMCTLQSTAVAPISKENITTKQSTLPVSFNTFKRYIINLPNIVSEMLRSQKFKGKSPEACARAYYEGFYLTPEIRENYAFELKPGPASMRKKIMSAPDNISNDETESTQSEFVGARQNNNDNQKNLLVENQQIFIPLNGTYYEFPISFQTFARYINYKELMDEIFHAWKMKKSKEMISNDRLLRRFYYTFYTDEKCRKKFNFHFNKPPLDLEEKLLQYAKPIFQPTNRLPIKEIHPQEVIRESACSIRKQKNEPLTDVPQEHLTKKLPISDLKFGATTDTPVVSGNVLEKLKKVSYPIAKNVEPPISFITFSKLFYLDDVIRQMQEDPEYTQLTEQQCALFYYEAFYKLPQIRERYIYKMKPCPVALREKVLQLGSVSTNKEDAPALSDLKTSKEIAEQVSTIIRQQVDRTTKEVAELYSARRASVKSMPKENLKVYSPSDLYKYISSNVSCPKKRALVEQRFLSLSFKQHIMSTSNEIKLVEHVNSFFFNIRLRDRFDELIYKCIGLNQNIWIMLSKMSYADFKLNTGIYNAEELYKHDSLLAHCYRCTIEEGSWPLNCYIKIKNFRQILQCKNIQFKVFDLQFLSPKLFHWSDLIIYTNFDKIVKSFFYKRKNREITDVTTLHMESKNLYNLCWLHNKWIYQVPIITEEILRIPDNYNVSVVVEEKPEDTGQTPSDDIEGHKNIFDNLNECQSTQAGEQDPIVAIGSDWSPVNIASQSPPATQCDVLDLPTYSPTQVSFVDIDDVCPSLCTQQTQSDPLMHTILVDLQPEEKLREVKCEQPIKFLDKLRFTLDGNQSDEFKCEVISTEELIINVDKDEGENDSELKCFELSTTDLNQKQSQIKVYKRSLVLDNSDTTKTLILDNHENVETAKNAIEESTEGRRTFNTNSTVCDPKILRTKENEVPQKKTRLMPKCIQLKHGFRSLPIHAVVRLEHGAVKIVETNFQIQMMQCQTNLAKGQQELQEQKKQTQLHHQKTSPMVDQPITIVTPITITASQALAADNTLFNSSELQTAIDTPFVPTRKVNDDTSFTNKISSFTSRSQLSKNVVFRKLEKYLYIDFLTPLLISKYGITSNALGQTYQQGTIVEMGRRCNIYGSLLKSLFPYCKRCVFNDLEWLMQDLGEFHYKFRENVSINKTEDLRLRVLHTFMETAPRFAYFHLQYEDDTQEWASCSVTKEHDYMPARRKPNCDLMATIKPYILKQIKKNTELLKFR